MTKAAWTAWGLGAGLSAAAVAWVPAARAADDDLTVVKRAVAVSSDEKDKDKDKDREAPARRAARRPTWLKVSVVEQKEGKKEATVSVTLPLALLAVLGKDASVDLSQLGVKGLRDNEKNVRILDVLETLEPGMTLVEVKEENEHVRVWVE